MQPFILIGVPDSGQRLNPGHFYYQCAASAQRLRVIGCGGCGGAQAQAVDSPLTLASFSLFAQNYVIALLAFACYPFAFACARDALALLTGFNATQWACPRWVTEGRGERSVTIIVTVLP